MGRSRGPGPRPDLDTTWAHSPTRTRSTQINAHKALRSLGRERRRSLSDSHVTRVLIAGDLSQTGRHTVSHTQSCDSETSVAEIRVARVRGTASVL